MSTVSIFYEMNPSIISDVEINFIAVVPHITDAIQNWVERVASQPVDKSGCTPDVCIIEVSLPAKIVTYIL